MTSLSWKRTVEQIALRNRNHRILGITSVATGAGVTLISRLTAKALADSGCRTLVVDLSQAVPADSAEAAPTAATFRNAIAKTQHGFDVLSFGGEDGGRAPRMVDLHEYLLRDAADYDNVILDVPAVLGNDTGRLSAVTVSAICNATLLVCALGKDKQADVSEVAGLLRGSGSALAGVVSNESFIQDSSAAAAFQRLAMRLRWRASAREQSGSPA